MTNRLDNKVAIITGGTRGIGYAIAEKFLEEGAKVIITGLYEDHENDSGIKAVQNLGHKGNVLFIKQDVADEDQWTTVFDQAEAKFGPVTTL